MGRRLYVGNLPYTTGEAELQELFSRAGTVESVRVMRDAATGRRLRTIRESGEPARQMRFSPDGRLLVVAESRFGPSADDRTRQARLYRVADGRELRTFGAEGEGPRTVFSMPIWRR